MTYTELLHPDVDGDAESPEPAPDSTVQLKSTSTVPPAREVASEKEALAVIEVRGQRFILERAGRGRYEVKSMEAQTRVGTITYSGGCMQLTVEKILMSTMVEVAKVALQLGALSSRGQPSSAPGWLGSPPSTF